MQRTIFNPGDRVRFSDTYWTIYGPWATVIDDRGPKDTYKSILPNDVCFRVDGINYGLDQDSPDNCHSISKTKLRARILEHIPFGKEYDPEQQPYTDEDI